MDRPARVRVIGPLEPYVQGFRGELARLGYTSWTAAAHLQLMAHVSRWLAHHGLSSNVLRTSAGR